MNRKPSRREGNGGTDAASFSQTHEDAKFLFRAAAQAANVADFILPFSRRSVEGPEAAAV